MASTPLSPSYLPPLHFVYLVVGQLDPTENKKIGQVSRSQSRYSTPKELKGYLDLEMFSHRFGVSNKRQLHEW